MVSLGSALSSPRSDPASALVHMKKLLRYRNWLCSPLLRLPTEIIVRILSFVMARLDSFLSTRPWGSVYLTCHHIHRIMCNTAELWWRVDCAYTKTAHFIFTLSKGDPRVLLSDLRSMEEDRLNAIGEMLDHWRDRQTFQGHRLRTLDFHGSPSSFSNFSWVLDRPLPRLRVLTINIIDSIEDDEMLPLSHPVELTVNTNMPLQVLNLRNVMLSWSSHSHLFNRLRELHLSFRDCDDIVTIPEDELFGILGASPQLEHLSLLRVGHEVPVRDGRLLPPRRILRLPSLTSLNLDNDPMVVKHTLAYMDLPAINSLKIRSFISWDVAHTLIDLLFPNDRLSSRLFPNPPTLAIRAVGFEEVNAAIEIDIGSVRLRLDFPFGQGERGRNIVMSCIPNLVPSSVIALKLEYTKLEEPGWRDFFVSHPEVRSIECTEFSGIPVSRSLWNALKPAGEGETGVPCPGLDSITVIVPFARGASFAPLSDCLRSRGASGFKLRHLKMMDHNGFLADVEGFYDEFGPLVEVAEARTNGFRQMVRTFSICHQVCADWPIVGTELSRILYRAGRNLEIGFSRLLNAYEHQCGGV